MDGRRSGRGCAATTPNGSLLQAQTRPIVNFFSAAKALRVGEEEYREIFRRAAASRHLTIGEDVLDQFINRCYKQDGREMRGCHPNAIVKHADDIRQFGERTDGLTKEVLDLAAKAYFIREQGSSTP